MLCAELYVGRDKNLTRIRPFETESEPSDLLLGVDSLSCTFLQPKDSGQIVMGSDDMESFPSARS